ncbi:hypothetical protein QE418_000635 [Microbacterium testaceum]|uniref:hypothetical protein n=1 Tax=Microbacterium TaxID=33882 RepID=UPI00278665D0|nr:MULTISPECIES: hypothetical protein [Microbacterium]MDQ1111187.1 hypothetical protein [Microbacterium testaceum]MDR6098273.1 hypothetical protein [Microbacterium sp. SORGH_AS_0454]
MGRTREERRAARALRRRLRAERKWADLAESLGVQLLPWQIDFLVAYTAKTKGGKR